MTEFVKADDLRVINKALSEEKDVRISGRGTDTASWRTRFGC